MGEGILRIGMEDMGVDIKKYRIRGKEDKVGGE